MSAKTGALWERKEEKEEEEDGIASANSKLFLNRRIHKDFRVNEIFRRKATKIGGVDDEDHDDGLDEFGNVRTDKKQTDQVEVDKEEKPKIEEKKDSDDKTEKKKVSCFSKYNSLFD